MLGLEKYSRRVLGIALLLSVFAFLAIGRAGREESRETRAWKSVPPIDIEASLSGGPSGPFSISARASSRLDAEIELELLLPGGITLVSGGRASKARRPELRAEAHAAAAPEGILVRATIHRGGARLSRVVPLALRPAPPAPGGVLKRNSRGEPIREFGP